MHQIVFILDDITPSVTAQRDRESPGGMNPIASLAIMGQALSIGVGLIVHSLTELSSFNRQNSECFFIFGNAGEDPRILSNVLHIDSNMIKQISSFRPGQFAALNPMLWTKTVYASFTELKLDIPCTETMRQDRAQQFMEEVTSTPPGHISGFSVEPEPFQKPAQSRQEPSDGLNTSELKFMILTITGLARPVTRIYQQMNLQRTQGRRITKRLEKLGYIKLHNFSTGKVGGKITLVEVTETAWVLLAGRGHKKPASQTNGSWEHETGAQLVAAEGRESKKKVSFEVDYDDFRADVQWHDDSGFKKIFNIAVSNPSYEVKAAEKYLNHPVSKNSEFTIVARDSAFAKKVRAEIKKADPHDKRFSSVKIKLLTDFIKD